MKLKKSREANLEQLRIFFFLMGLCFSAAMVLSAFEWRSEDRYVEPDKSINDEWVIFEEPELVYLPREELVTKKENEPIIDVIEIVDETKRFKDDKGSESSPHLAGNPILEHIGHLPEIVEEEELPTPESTAPMFPGGMTALADFLKKNLRYPPQARTHGVKGTVWITFLVDKNGYVSQIKTLKGIGMGCDEEAMRVVSMMPKWIPGKQRGRTIEVLYKLPVKFNLR